MGITVLGPLTVDGSGLRSRRDRVVLAVLAAHAGQPVTADQLIDAIWGDSPPASATKNLQGCVVRLRRVLQAGAIATSPQGYTLTVPSDHVDAQRFQRLVDRARELLLLEESDRSAFLLGEALALWRGDPFPDLDDWAPAGALTHHLRELRLEAEELRAEAALRSGRHDELLAECQRLVREAPLRERRWTLLARAQYVKGNQAEALSSVRRLRSVLSQQLGIDPSQDVVELEQAILRQDTALAGDPPPPDRGTCPWQGLRAYDVGDAEWFFGRGRDVEACLDILWRGPVLTLVGPSGCGKSSLLRAGVAAALRARGERLVVITPGTRPTQALSALARVETDAVLLVDQAEEVFTLCEDDEERDEFLDALRAEVDVRTVLIALRADRLADLAGHTAMSRVVERGLYIVGGLDEEGLRAAVEGPARQAGMLVEPGLVDLLVSEVRHDPGALPLLSHALLETWKRREGRTLTVAGYLASGGIRDALAQSAEHLYARVVPGRRDQLRELMLRLVAPDDDGEPVRMRVPRRLVTRTPEHEQLVEMLVAARLVTSDAGVLEISHEALARSWPRLRGWLEDDLEGQRILHHLSATADAWDSLGRPDSELYRGVRLARAVDWQTSRHASLTAVEQDFLTESRVAEDLEERSVTEQALTQARLIRRLRVVLTGAVALLVLALAAGGLAAVQSGRAQRNADDARAAESTAELSARSALARSAAARAGVTDDPALALLLGVAAVRMEESSETVTSLQGALAQTPALIRSTPLAGEAMALDVDPDGRTAAVLDILHRARLVDLRTGAVLAERQVGKARNEREELRFLEFSSDGKVLVAGNAALTRSPVRLLDPRTLRPLRRQPRVAAPGPWVVADLGFSQDDRSLVAVLNRTEWHPEGRRVTGTWVYVWRLDAPARPVRFELDGAADRSPAGLSPDGRLLYTGWPHVAVRDLAGGRSRVLARRHADALDLSPDGRLLAVTSGPPRDGITLLDATTGRVRQRLSLEGTPGLVRFSDNGHRVAAVTWHDRAAAVWDVRTGEQVATLRLGQGSSGAVDFDRTARRLVSAGPDGALRRWDLDGRQRYLRRIPVAQLPWTPDGGACLAVPSPDGTYVGYGRCDTRTVVTLDVARRRGSPERPAGSGLFEAAGSWDPTGHSYVTAVGGRLFEYDGRTGRVRRTADPLHGHATDFSYTADGSRLVATDDRGRVGLLDAATLDRVGRPVAFDDVVWGVAGPDDRHAFVLVGGPNRTFFWMDSSTGWAVADLERGTVVDRGPLDVGVVNHLAYAPDGRHGALASSNGQVPIIDLETGLPVRNPAAQNVHAGGAGWVAFSPDGTRLASGGFDGSVALWDVETGLLTARVRLDHPVLSSAAFLPGGRVLIVPWWEDPAVYVWDPRPERALAFACKAAGRDLTEAEWAQYFGTEPQTPTCPAPAKPVAPATTTGPP